MKPLNIASQAGPSAAAEAPPTDRTLESGWATEGYVDPGYEAERAQIAFDDAGQGISLWPTGDFQRYGGR